ncbi:MAG: discoidin domain-containing protein, partial [Pseudomonadota bacterium]
MRKALKLFLLAFALSLFTHSAMAQNWPVTKVATSSALWPNTNLYDNNPGTVWTSNGYADPNHQEWLAYWFDGFHPVNTIKLYPRYAGGRTLGFPTAFNVYWSDGSNWNLAQSYGSIAMPAAGNYVTLKLPSTVNANGIQVIATQLGQDDVGNYYFQIGEVGATSTDVVATDYFRNPLPGSPILSMAGDVPTSVLVSGVLAPMHRVKHPTNVGANPGTPSDPLAANPGIPKDLATYGGVTRECLKLNPNATAPDWACYSTFPGDYLNSIPVLESPQMNAVCGTPARVPAIITSCSSGQCTSEIFMKDCQTGYPSLVSSRFFNSEKTELNYGNTIDDPDFLSKQSFSGQYYVTGNYNTALQVLQQGRIPVVSIPIFNRPLTGGSYSLRPDAEQILNNAVAQYPQLFASGARISIVDEPFWNGKDMVQGQALEDEITALRLGIAMMQRKLPWAKFGLNLVGLESKQPQMMDAMKKLLTPTGGVSISLQWLSSDIYVSSFDIAERNSAFNAANWFANYMKTTAPFNTMERWLVVQGFGPFAHNVAPPPGWSVGMENDFKSIMSTMGIAGLNYTGLVVWGWDEASELDDRFTGKYFSTNVRRVYQAPVCSGVSLTAASLPASGGTVTAQAACSNDISTYAWTVNGNAFGGNTPSIGITLTANSSTVAINYKVCFTAINIAHTAPVCNNLVQAAASAATVPGAPAISSVLPGNSSVTVAFNPGGLGSGTLVNYTASCGSVTVNGNGSPIIVTGLTNGTSRCLSANKFI